MSKKLCLDHNVNSNKEKHLFIHDESGNNINKL